MTDLNTGIEETSSKNTKDEFFSKLKKLLWGEKAIDNPLDKLGLYLKLSIILGFGLLLSYTRENSIPFPLSLSELPATFLVIVFIGLTGLFSIVFFFLLPYFTRFSFFNGSIIGPSPLFSDDKASKGVSAWFIHFGEYLVTLGAPVFLVFGVFAALSINWEISEELTLFLIGLVASAMFASFCFFYFGGWQRIKENSEEIPYLISFAIYVLSSMVWCSIVLYVLLVFSPISHDVINENPLKSVAIATLILLILHYCFSSVISGNPIWLAFLAIMTVVLFTVLAFLPTSGEFITRSSLKHLNLVAVEKEYTFRKDAIESLPKEIAEKAVYGSVTLHVALDIGNIVYVRTKGDISVPPTGINRRWIVSEKLIQSTASTRSTN